MPRTRAVLLAQAQRGPGGCSADSASALSVPNAARCPTASSDRGVSSTVPFALSPSTAFISIFAAVSRASR